MAQQVTTHTKLGTSSTPNLTWVIDNFTISNTKKFFSDVFSVAGYKWQLIVYPNVKNGFSVFLHISGSEKLPSEWSIDVEFGFTLVNQIHRKKSITRRTKHQFREGENDHGYPYFVYHTKLHDPTKGYIVNDTVIIETHVTVVLDTSSSRDSEKKVMDDQMIIPLLEPNTSHPGSSTSSSMSGQSSSVLLDKSKNLLTELSILRITRKPTSASSREVFEANLQPQRKALRDCLALSLEDIDHQANGFDDIEKISLLLLQYSTSSLERTNLKNLLSRLMSFRGIVPATKSSIENMRAQKISLSGKKADVRTRLYQGQEQLSSLEVEFSKLLEEEREIEAQITGLIAQKEVALAANNNRIQAGEKLAQAQLTWQLFNRNLELREKF